MNSKREFRESLVLGEMVNGKIQPKSREEQMIIQAQLMEKELLASFPKLIELRNIAVDNLSKMLGLNEEQKYIIANKRDTMYRESVFQQDCVLMNMMYQVNPEKPGMTVPTSSELNGFRCTLVDEVSEVDEIVNRCQDYEECDKTSPEAEELKVEIIVAFVDWIVDIQVFCMSQCLRYGINPVPAMQVVMDSNFTKLGADGKPIFDENKKFLKGPNYKKPEPAIREMIVDALKRAEEMNRKSEQ